MENKTTGAVKAATNVFLDSISNTLSRTDLYKFDEAAACLEAYVQTISTLLQNSKHSATTERKRLHSESFSQFKKQLQESTGVTEPQQQQPHSSTGVPASGEQQQPHAPAGVPASVEQQPAHLPTGVSESVQQQLHLIQGQESSAASQVNPVATTNSAQTTSTASDNTAAATSNSAATAASDNTPATANNKSALPTADQGPPPPPAGSVEQEVRFRPKIADTALSPAHHQTVIFQNTEPTPAPRLHITVGQAPVQHQDQLQDPEPPPKRTKHADGSHSQARARESQSSDRATSDATADGRHRESNGKTAPRKCGRRGPSKDAASKDHQHRPLKNTSPREPRSRSRDARHGRSRGGATPSPGRGSRTTATHNHSTRGSRQDGYYNGWSRRKPLGSRRGMACGRSTHDNESSDNKSSTRHGIKRGRHYEGEANSH